MGIVLDSSVLIAGDRRGQTLLQLLHRVSEFSGGDDLVISSVTIVELVHGIYRANTEAHRTKRQEFCDELVRVMTVHPLTVEIAQLAGRIEGELASRGIRIDFADLLIGATAAHVGYAVATLNSRHFHLIPGLRVMPIA